VACHAQFESPLDYSPRVGSAAVIKNYPDLFTLARVVLLACHATPYLHDM
jgi:hypothetical protein